MQEAKYQKILRAGWHSLPDKVLRIIFLNFDVRTLIKKKVVCSKFKRICPNAIDAKSTTGTGKVFEKHNELKLTVRKYLGYHRSEEVLRIIFLNFDVCTLIKKKVVCSKFKRILCPNAIDAKSTTGTGKVFEKHNELKLTVRKYLGYHRSEDDFDLEDDLFDYDNDHDIYMYV
jgi:calcineurin-like phosphoesterase